MEKQGKWDHRDKGDGGGKRDLYYDPETGEIYEKPKGGQSPVEPIHLNVHDLSTAVVVGGAAIVTWEVVKWVIGIAGFPEASPVLFIP